MEIIEIRGFGTLVKKLIKKNLLETQRQMKSYSKKSYKLHFKIGKILHKKINPSTYLKKEDVF